MKWLHLIFLSVSVVAVSVVGFSLAYLNYTKRPIISPVFAIPKMRLSDNIWVPNDPTNLDLKTAPQVTAKSAFFVEIQTGEVLYQKNPDQKLHIASLTKIMTTIVALENRSLEDMFSVSDHAANMEPDKMLLKANERLTLRELLNGIFLVSANDAAEAIAENVTGRREEFLALMNSKALQLGMNNTKFINPSGLEEDGREQFSSARDVLVMSRYAIAHWPEILEISSQPHIYMEKNDRRQDYDLYSGINLLTTYPGVMGLKTGFTPEAGLTLVTFAKRDDKQVMGVLLGATDRRDDAKALLDYSFKKLGVPIR